MAGQAQETPGVRGNEERGIIRLATQGGVVDMRVVTGGTFDQIRRPKESDPLPLGRVHIVKHPRPRSALVVPTVPYIGIAEGHRMIVGQVSPEITDIGEHGREYAVRRPAKVIEREADVVAGIDDVIHGNGAVMTG